MNRIAQLRRSQEGFTLIELLVVVAIIALLATFAVPKLFDAINKSKGAVGDADLDTISSAMERYYFDNDMYPVVDATPTVAADLTTGTTAYLKAATNFLNGFKKGYIYLSDANGRYFVMVDPGNNTGNVTVTCGSWAATVAVSTTGLATGTMTYGGAAPAPAAPSSANLAACTTTPASLSFVTN